MQPSVKHYPNPPIIEAIIDIQTSLTEINNENIENIKAQLAQTYPLNNEIKIVSFSTQIKNDETSNSFVSQNENLGTKFTSVDNKFVAQFRKSGFTLSRLAPYENWDNFISEAKKLWQLYCQEIKPSRITRLAVRYINRIDIPAVNFKLEDYFQTYPMIADDIKGELSGFVMQAQIHLEDNIIAVINQAVTTSTKPKDTSIILDIDVFNMTNISSENNELTFWNKLELLKEHENTVFESSIKEKTRELFI